MTLPLVIDVAIGLIFIYLTLSLLTSEIQEIITTLLQWRAEHLKKSIDNLLNGEAIATDLYQTPLIQSLNQEAKGFFALFFRGFTHAIGDISHRLGSKRNFGNQRSGPSYIPSETFSVALLQQINFEKVSQRISELTAHSFLEQKLDAVEEVLDSLRNSLGDYSLLQNEFNALKESLTETLDDLCNRRTTLSQCIQESTQEIVQFIDYTTTLLEDNNHCKEIVRGRLPYLKQIIMRRPLDPKISEVLTLLFNQVEGDRASASISPRLVSMVNTIRMENPELFQSVRQIPDELKQNLLSLAEHAQLRVDQLEDGVRQMEAEVATWFDRSMDRASGVYRRNARGIAILIGFLVAVVVNADTLYMVSRLSRDTALRAAIADVSNQIVAQDTTRADLQTELAIAKDAISSVLNDLPLPIGWDAVNVQQQTLASQEWLFPPLRRVVGWALTGIALSMGASFWYDLLSRVMRVRSTGKPPRKSDTETTDE